MPPIPKRKPQRDRRENNRAGWALIALCIGVPVALILFLTFLH